MAMPSQGLRMPGHRRQPVCFSFDGKPIAAFAGETLAAVLLAAGIRVLGHNREDLSPSGMFCAMGVCQECVLLVDDRLVEACRTQVRDGMTVRRAV
jgi:predicted molibdopterin-dependent oxidoreductase YjgC